MRHHNLAATLILATLSVLVHSQVNTCSGRSCYPATGNLLVGREDRLIVNSTCGSSGHQRYCVVGDTRERKKCFTCDSRDPWSEANMDSHNITNIVTSHSDDRLRRWWQSENGKEKVSIQLDLDAEFHFTHLIITFKTFRPKAMFIERSYDFGNSWLPYRYFADDCKRAFPDIAMGPVKSLKEPVICQEKYSRVLPASLGEIVFKVLPTSDMIDDPYSQEVQDLLKLTNIRVVMTALHTLGDDLLDRRRDINEKYYYAIYDMIVRGSCSCYGHASECRPARPEDYQVQNMVHSVCQCKHNTKGKNCDQCADFFNDKPWMPAVGDQTGECKRCECHEHATSCHFDPAVYHSRGNVSGGVCDNCMHNTDGLNCESCKSHFFQDPTKDLRDENICQPCDCDPTGTENNGECDMRDDQLSGLIAGRCKCKPNVSGVRCDRCEQGYWNFQDDGCQQCQCNKEGTYDNDGCNQFTGDCTCKRYVVGRNCDQCAEQYWGLSSQPEGCKPCGCDIGGSYDNFCDVTTGQCNCKTGITGIRCDRPIDSFFIPDLDYLIFEGEYADGTGRPQVVLREPKRGEDSTWTGPGFMRIFEGDKLRFKVDDLPASMNFELIIRYEPQMPDGWNDVRINIERPDDTAFAFTPDHPCVNVIPQDDNLATSLSPGSRHSVVSPSICLEGNKTYYITLDFERYQRPDDTPSANILIDSIVLVPVFTDFCNPRQNTRCIAPADLIYCNSFEYDVTDDSSMPDKCKKLMFSIGIAITQKAYECDCDPTGSESSICDAVGGKCPCKPNVYGRKCDKCMPGSYNLGPSGCTKCNCNSLGAYDGICDETSGQCLCKPSISGRACDVCERGMFNFPSCQRCVCNGHAETCEDSTGACINCDDFTTGPQCDQCVSGYFGAPLLGSSIPCTECMCPGGVGDGPQHATECELDRITRQMKCLCPDEFAGNQCELCAINHFGNPLDVNGTCESCAEGCNYNIDTLEPGSCDAVTGKCLKCIDNTEGDECELCATGYYGDATVHSCVTCTCNALGTRRDANGVSEPCDRDTGICPCQDNVIGETCDTCAPDHWGIALGDGCVPCDCDPEGSNSSECQEFTGMCTCKPGRGGDKCDECVYLQWGDPTTECFDCDCNPDGSEHLQCNAKSGQCSCLEGIAGLQCDRCDRGTTGILPNCAPCGECFDSWDKILVTLREQTDELINKVNVTKTEGAVGVYDEAFMNMEKQLDEVKKILDGFNETAADMTSALEDFNKLRMELESAKRNLTKLGDDLKLSNQELSHKQTAINSLDFLIEDLKRLAETTRNQVDASLEEDIQGAYNTIKTNKMISDDALSRARETDDINEETLQYVEDTRMLLNETSQNYERVFNETSDSLNEIEDELTIVRNNLISPDGLNKQVCDMKDSLSVVFTNPCDALCGGGGCWTCGGASCTEGAVGKVAQATEFAEQAEETSAEKNDLAKKQLEKYDSTLLEVNTVHNFVRSLVDKSKSVYNMASETSIELDAIVNKLRQFLTDDNKMTSAEVQAIVNEVLSLSLPMSKEDIEELADQIESTYRNLTNIDTILAETKNELELSQMLKQRAVNASIDAAAILQQVNDLNMKLTEAREIQNSSRTLLDQAKQANDMTQQKLTSIGDIMKETVDKANELKTKVANLKVYVDDVSKDSTKNSIDVENAQQRAELADVYANEAVKDAEKIKTEYGDKGISDQIEREYLSTDDAHRRAMALDKATTLAGKLSQKLAAVQGLKTAMDEQEAEMDNLDKEFNELLQRMESYNKDLGEIETYHRTCQPTDP